MNFIQKAYVSVAFVMPTYNIAESYQDGAGIVAAGFVGILSIYNYVNYLKTNENDEIMHVLGLAAIGVLSGLASSYLLDSYNGNEISLAQSNDNGNLVSVTETTNVEPFARRTLNGQIITFG